MKRYYLIDHKILFLFGYIFYLFVPYYVGTRHLFEGYPGMELFKSYFDLIPADKLTSYFLITLSWLPAFYLGHFLLRFIVPYKRPLHLFDGSTTAKGISVIAIFLFFLLIIFVWLGRHSLFAGYKSYDVGTRGKFSTLMV